MQTAETRSRIQTICLMVITAAIALYVVYWLRPVLIPFVLAIFVVSGVTPILQMLERGLGVSRLVATAITFVTGVVILVSVGSAIWFSVLQLAGYAPAYRQRIRELAVRVEDWVPDDVFTRIGSPWAPRPDEEELEPSDAPSPGVRDVQEPRSGELVDSFVREGISAVSGTLVSLVTTGVVVLIYVFFLLLGTVEQASSGMGWQHIDHQIRSYIALKSVISLVTGAAFGLALHLFGVPMAVTFGVLAFMLNFVPNIGPIVASALPIPFIVLQPEASIGWIVAVLAVTLGIQVLSGNVIEPKLMGESADLHPVTVLFALMFWGMLWGIIGMFLATPITAGLKIVLERFETTRPVANLLAGRLPESFGNEPPAPGPE